MKKIILSILVLLFYVGIAQADEENITGEAQTRNGDTLIVDGESIRLDGVDVPEKNQTCKLLDSKDKLHIGNEARAWMESYVGDKHISCSISKKGAFGRPIVTCFIEGQNLNELLVRNGYGAVDPRYNQRYLKFQKEAQEKKIGMWAGKCKMPWTFRKEEKKKERERAKKKREREKAKKEREKAEKEKSE